MSALTIGPTKYSRGGAVAFGWYGSGELAIQVLNADGERELVATVSLLPYGAPDPGRHGVWLKDWSENEGVADALVQAGIVRLTGRTHPTGYVHALHAELTDASIAQLPEIFRRTAAAVDSRSSRG